MSGSSAQASEPLLDVRGLTVEFSRNGNTLRAVDNVSFSISPGETLCLVGESGSGKSVTALSMARLVPSPPARYASGTVLVDGRDVMRMSPAELRSVRGGLISYVFQEPASSLNPVFRVAFQIKEALKLHRPESASDDEIVRLLKLVGIAAPEARMRDYPHNLSGGMQQRVMIAMAIASQPRLLIADEPTTALDVTIQAQIIDLLGGLKQRLGMSILLITHNLGIVGQIADRLAVMYAGQIVESGSAKDVLATPFHPYTRALLASVPAPSARLTRLRAISGAVPSLGAFPSGCRFHPRCPIARKACSETMPELVEASPRHWVRCPYFHDSP